MTYDDLHPFQSTPSSEENGDVLAFVMTHELKCFNPRRPPKRTATPPSGFDASQAISFNPRRPPKRTATWSSSWSAHGSVFQSTPSSEENGDLVGLPAVIASVRFQSTPSPKRTATTTDNKPRLKWNRTGCANVPTCMHQTRLTDVQISGLAA